MLQNAMELVREYQGIANVVLGAAAWWMMQLTGTGVWKGTSYLTRLGWRTAFPLPRPPEPPAPLPEAVVTLLGGIATGEKAPAGDSEGVLVGKLLARTVGQVIDVAAKNGDGDLTRSYSVPEREAIGRAVSARLRELDEADRELVRRQVADAVRTNRPAKG